MKSTSLALGIMALTALLPGSGFAQDAVKKPVAEAVKKNGKKSHGSGSHSRLTDILKSAGFGNALGGGAYTIFAPTNSAFAKLPQGHLSDLLRPENRNRLKMIMAHHVVRGNVTSDDLMRAVNEGNGAATFKTLAGDSLTFRKSGSGVTVSDSRGNVSLVNASNMRQSGSIVHAVDTIMM